MAAMALWTTMFLIPNRWVSTSHDYSRQCIHLRPARMKDLWTCRSLSKWPKADQAREGSSFVHVLWSHVGNYTSL